MKTRALIITLLISLVWTVCASALDVKLSWDANVESDLAGYKVYYGVGGLSSPTSLDVNNQTYATIASLDPGLNYVFAVKAYNSSGMEAPYSNQVTVPESVLPVVSITSPANNIQVMNTVSILATATDNVGVTKVEYYFDGALKATDSAAPYQYDWDTSTVAAGTHSITAKAYDAAGNIGVSSISVVVVKDATPPTVVTTSPASGSIINGIVSFSCNASDNVGVSMVEFYVNGVIRAAVNASPYIYSWDTNTVSDGVYALTAKAYDAAGHASTSSSISVTVKNTVSDLAAPVVNSFAMPTTANSFTVGITSFSATDNVGVTGYMVTGSATAPAATATGWSSSALMSYTFSSAGNQVAYAWVKDAAGNVSVSRTASVTISLSSTYTIADALLALQIGSGKLRPSAAQMARLDVAPVINGKSVPNGKVDTGDAIALLSRIIGKTSF